MMEFDADNLTQIVVALVVAFQGILLARFSIRRESQQEKADRETLNRLRSELARCLEDRDKERALYFETLSKKLE